MVTLSLEKLTKRRVLEIFYVLMEGFFAGFFLPFIFLTAFQGGSFDVYKENAGIYIGIAVGVAFIFAFLKFLQSVIESDPEFERTFIGSMIKCIIHDPVNDGIPGMAENKFFGWIKSPLNLFFVSLLVFYVFGSFMILFPQTALAPGLSPELMEATDIGKIGLSIEPQAWGETSMLLLFSLLFVNPARWFLKKFNQEWWVYLLIITVIISPIGALLWTAIHIYVFKAVEEALLYAFYFGYLSTFITFVLGSIIPAVIYHRTNNFLLKIKELFSSDLVISISFVAVLVLIAIVASLTVRYIKQLRRVDIYET